MVEHGVSLLMGKDKEAQADFDQLLQADRALWQKRIDERTAAVSAITRMLENKTLINNVALSMPLNDIVAAHEAVEQGRAIGNVVVTL